MPPRASKRLKSAADKAVATTVETATKTVVRKASTSKKVTTVTEQEVSVAVAEEVTTTTPTKKKTTAASSTDAKAAWGALFAPSAKKTKKLVSADGERVWPRPKRVDGALSADLQKKIAAFAQFEGVTSTKQHPDALKLVAWNVNGLRALLKKEDTVHLRAYAAQEDPDVLCLSETKIDIDELQKLEDVLPQYEYQYWSSAAKKGYAGTAILSKTKPLSVRDEIVVEGKPDDEGRFLALEYETFWLVHTYVPNSGQKLERLSFRTEQWDKAMLKLLKELEETKPVVWCGDLNVAHQEIDIHDPKGNRNKSAGFTDAERESFTEILESGFVDAYRHLNPETVQYTYWSYRFGAKAKNKGWRLDYFVLSKSLLDRVETSFVRQNVDGSDHVPIGLELKRE